MQAPGEQLAQLLDRPEVLRSAQIFILLLCRLAPLVVFSPLFGGASTSVRFRLGLGGALCAALTPVASTGAAPVGEFMMLMLTAKELLLGATLAVLVTAIFELFAASGSLIDRTRGVGSIADVPGGAGLSAFLKLFFVTLFVVVGGHRVFFAAFGEGLIRVPLVAPMGDLAGATVTGLIASLTGELFAVAIQLALPIVAIALAVDVVLGILNRATGHLSAFFMGLSIKGLLGIAVLLLVLRIGTEEFLEAVPPLVRRLTEMR